MAIGLMPERPPYVDFYVGEVEDRNASIEAGRYIARDVEMVRIMPAGSKDTVEREAVPWLADIKERSLRGQYNPAWLQHFEAKYRAWKEGLEIPLNGTPIRTWPLLSPAQVKNLTGARVLTVEDLAAANEDTIRMLGMGARDLKAKAVAYLEQARDGGASAAKLAAMTVELEALKTAKEESDKTIASLLADLEARTAPRRGKSERLVA